MVEGEEKNVRTFLYVSSGVCCVLVKPTSVPLAPVGSNACQVSEQTQDWMQVWLILHCNKWQERVKHWMLTNWKFLQSRKTALSGQKPISSSAPSSHKASNIRTVGTAMYLFLRAKEPTGGGRKHNWGSKDRASINKLVQKQLSLTSSDIHQRNDCCLCHNRSPSSSAFCHQDPAFQVPEKDFWKKYRCILIYSCSHIRSFTSKTQKLASE